MKHLRLPCPSSRKVRLYKVLYVISVVGMNLTDLQPKRYRSTITGARDKLIPLEMFRNMPEFNLENSLLECDDFLKELVPVTNHLPELRK